MYYVYELIDPRDNVPFYVGKGKDKRAQSHLWKIPDTRNVYKENKIKSIREAGFEPQIKYVITGIKKEKLAYDIEEYLILVFGRKGYEKDGILTNVGLGTRPPNHKGKTYVEIYGSQERAKEEVEKRREIQLNYGGFGPKKHSDETKNKIRLTSTGERNGMFGKHHSEETKQKIKANQTIPEGIINHRSFKYILISPNLEETVLYGAKELVKFCLENNLSYGSLQKTIQHGTYPLLEKILNGK